MDSEADQRAVCERFGVSPVFPDGRLKLGIAHNVGTGLWPLNGLRHNDEAGTVGWYLWAGEVLEERDDFFVPLHVEHMELRCPEAVRYLALPPGWRVLIAPDHEDVWFDPALLTVDG